jgi:D-psicose/D-tagatose/L-ribulose 3-epimerase
LFMSYQFRHAMCNEAFRESSFAEGCRAIRKAGYHGIELAPFTLAERPSEVPAECRRELRDIMQSEGLTFAGMHWLMASPKGLHATGPDAELRRRSWQHIDDLIDLCADLGPSGVLVFGSPMARSTNGVISREEATKNFRDGFASVARHAEDRGVTVLVEALPADQCDVVQTLGEAVAMVEEIGSPAVRTMFDVHNAVDEREPHDQLIDRYFEYIKHVHVNEMDGKHCGAGNYDYKPVLAALRRRDYTGWVSLEAFDLDYGGEKIAEESLRHIEAEIERLPA